MLDRTQMSAAALLRRLLQRARQYDVVVLDGAVGASGGFVDRVAATVLARGRTGPQVVISDSTWGPGRTAPSRRARRLGVRLLDSPRVTYCVLSSDEARTFPRTFGVPPERVVVTPFYWTLPDELRALPAGVPVFAGGDSLRDYPTLLTALSSLPEIPTTVATRWQPESPLPPGVRLGPVTADEFLTLLRAAAVVVVPLEGGLVRSAGQQTYLNGMALGKVVIVTQAPGVLDHIEPGRTGLVVPPSDPSAMAAALSWALDPANGHEARVMGSRAAQVARERFGPDQYVATLLRVVDTVGSR